MARADELAITPQSQDFSAWYNEIVQKAELADRGPVRGTMVIRPYGYRIWELLQSELDSRIKATGHQNAYFPLFIPEEYLKREAEHVEGFSPELAVVTHAGGKQLEEPLVVRPTSETVIGEMMSNWIDSYRDLPLKLNQWANVVRWEMRPRLFLRTTEFLWQEGHTAHASEKDAREEVMTALDFYREIADEVALLSPVMGEKTPGERFAGALNTYSLEAMMRDGKALQAATSHYLGTNFSKAFNISYQSKEGDLRYCYTTSWGMSTRLIGAIIMSHGDDRGLILPPKLAPYQVVIVPIHKGPDNTQIKQLAEQFSLDLEASGIRTHVDDREYLSPGFKFNSWEQKGVPLRCEFGERDISKGLVTLHNRLTSEKQLVAIDQLSRAVKEGLHRFGADLYKRAREFRLSNTKYVASKEEFFEALQHGFVIAEHCGNKKCEDDIKEISAATPRCIPFDAEETNGKCIMCGEESPYKKPIIFAKAY
jgi:prolyl-tRNA synthetase